MNRKAICFFLLLIGVFVLMPGGVMAKSIVKHQNTVIPANQTVDDVVVTGGSLLIAGNVRGDVLVFHGDVTIKSSAHIKGMVIVLSGSIQQETGATLSDEVVDLSLNHPLLNSLVLGAGMLAAILLVQLVSSIVLTALSAGTVYWGRSLLNPYVGILRQSPWRALGIGFAGSLLLLAVFLLLILSVIGIPVAVFMLLFVCLIFLFGLALVAILVGERIQPVSKQGSWYPCLIGSSITVAGINIPVLGIFILIGIQWMALGVLIIRMKERFGRGKR